MRFRRQKVHAIRYQVSWWKTLLNFNMHIQPSGDIRMAFFINAYQEKVLPGVHAGKAPFSDSSVTEKVQQHIFSGFRRRV